MTLIKKEKVIDKFNEQIAGSIDSNHANAFRHAINIINMMDGVQHSTVTNSDDYKEHFDSMIYNLILDISREKGFDGSAFTCNSFIEEVRNEIIKIANNYHLDLSTPEKEYDSGDKVSLYYEGIPITATIVCCTTSGEYGLLIDGNFIVILVEESDSPTNYIIELQKHINIE